MPQCSHSAQGGVASPKACFRRQSYKHKLQVKRRGNQWEKRSRALPRLPQCQCAQSNCTCICTRINEFHFHRTFALLYWPLNKRLTQSLAGCMRVNRCNRCKKARTVNQCYKCVLHSKGIDCCLLNMQNSLLEQKRTRVAASLPPSCFLIQS